MDFSPPRVISVYPAEGKPDYMNTALQINFNEPMDPTGLQGSFVAGTDGSYYVLQGGNIFLKTPHSSLPAGSFNIVNNYQTLEFIPSRECGENTCGGKVYCMNVCDKANRASCKDIVFDDKTFKIEDFQMVVKAATIIKAGSFEANSFTGAMDMASNALDSVPLGVANTATVKDPTVADFFGNNPDNFYWSFQLSDKKYDIPPVLNRVVPGLDAGSIKATQDWKMDFSGVMLFDSLYSIGLEEYSSPAQTVPLCKAPRAILNAGTNTSLVSMFHCPFLDGRFIYYFPILTSDLMEVHFNCFNPGKGPGGEAELLLKASESSVCDETHPENCCVVDETGKDQERIFCCNGVAVEAKNSSTKCIEILKTISPLSL